MGKRRANAEDVQTLDRGRPYWPMRMQARDAAALAVDIPADMRAELERLERGTWEGNGNG